MKKYHSRFGDERRQDMHGTVAEPVRKNIELFCNCNIDLINSTMWKCHAPWFVPMRRINNDFMIFVYKGKMRVETRFGVKILRRGDFMLCAPGEDHSFGFKGNLKYDEHVIVHTRISFPNFPFRENIFETSFLRLPNPDAFLEDLKVLPFLCDEKAASANLYAENILRNMFMELCLNGETPVCNKVSIDERLAEGMRFMQEHFQSPVSINNVAAYVDLSEPHFRKIFRDQTKRTPLDFLTEIRLQHACILLHESRMKINEISAESGFNSVDYFCRVFKSKFHCTPSEYRQRDKFV